jgi:hypothetical protein
MEDDYPGLWHRLYRHQCVAIGWPPPRNKLNEKAKERGFARACKALSRMAVGDYVIAALKNHRVARLGQITALAVDDDEWDPLVPKSKNRPVGQMGRRIQVRWDLACGPTDQDLVVSLPEGSRLASGELLPTIALIKSITLTKLRRAMNDPANWIGLLAHFNRERALSDYIAGHPDHLEDGLVPHPDSKVREKVFPDRKRSDVLLLDREERPVVVECKQGAPTVKHLKQLRRYMKLVQKETRNNKVRGILVHGGSLNLRQEVVRAAKRSPVVEIVQHHLHVDFNRGYAG